MGAIFGFVGGPPDPDGGRLDAMRHSPEAAMRVWTAARTECWAQEFVDGGGAPPS